MREKKRMEQMMNYKTAQGIGRLRVTPAERLILMFIQSKGLPAQVSYAQISGHSGLSRRQCITLVRGLRDKGLLIKSVTSKGNMYSIPWQEEKGYLYLSEDLQTRGSEVVKSSEVSSLLTSEISSPVESVGGEVGFTSTSEVGFTTFQQSGEVGITPYHYKEERRKEELKKSEENFEKEKIGDKKDISNQSNVNERKEPDERTDWHGRSSSEVHSLVERLKDRLRGGAVS